VLSIRVKLPAMRFAARLPLLLCLSVALVASSATAAGAEFRRPVPASPKQRATVPKRTPITFKVRDSFIPGPGRTVWVIVSDSKHVRKDGTLKKHLDFGRAKRVRRGSKTFRYVAKFFDFPAFYMNRPGRYYWQPYRIDCRRRDCRVEGRIRTFYIGP
jgi:hypothetical protein